MEQQRFGYAPGPELRGRWTVRWTLLRDLAALTGFEPLTSDAWGIVTGTADPEEERLLFDRVATASTLPERRVLAEDPRLAVPRVITTHPYLTGRSYEVDLVADGSLSA
ncbi:hypothetical protein P5G50_06540 [Leifsonia sp. F6_8S_P_1B]|uniref:UTRA domain-containing protein n=1 Tax=Leifsonia williamsii TaxID=3035919 RepID=A0ABT8K9H3_9MICO|nr:hypothetical protein [Leifsonia williamsii]MDN4614108.1 hypothetical protein [Leifsonia williamsii]